MNKTTDMTQGSPDRLLLGFGIPMLAANICQQLYSMVDSAVVGRLIGVDAFAAVGAAGFLSWLVVDIILGAIQGFGVVFAQAFGKKQQGLLSKAIAMAILLGIGLGALLTAAGLLCARPVLLLVDTPADILPDALTYLYWIFWGTMVTVANRLTGTLLLALGDSRGPLIAVIASSVLNVALDLLLVAVFHWGVAGVAIATVVAQLLSCLFCLWRIKAIPQAHIKWKDFTLCPATIKELVHMAAPLAFRNGVISVGGLFVQAAINQYGKLFVAGVTASKKYFGLLELGGVGMDGAFATFSAQNYGAGDLPRIKAGLRSSIKISLIGSGLVLACMVLLGQMLIGLLVSGDPQEIGQVVEAGYQCLLATAATIPMMFLLCIYRSGLQGMGSTFAPTLSGFVELGLRIVSVTLLPGLLGRWAIYFADPLGWLGAMVLLGAAYHRVYRRRVAQRAG